MTTPSEKMLRTVPKEERDRWRNVIAKMSSAYRAANAVTPEEECEFAFSEALLNHAAAMDEALKRERENGYLLATYLNQLHPMWKCGSSSPAGCGLCVLLAVYATVRSVEERADADRR